jgi:hypothetical protein
VILNLIDLGVVWKRVVYETINLHTLKIYYSDVEYPQNVVEQHISTKVGTECMKPHGLVNERLYRDFKIY